MFTSILDINPQLFDVSVPHITSLPLQARFSSYPCLLCGSTFEVVDSMASNKDGSGAKRSTGPKVGRFTMQIPAAASLPRSNGH